MARQLHLREGDPVNSGDVVLRRRRDRDGHVVVDHFTVVRVEQDRWGGETVVLKRRSGRRYVRYRRHHIENSRAFAVQPTLFA